MKVVDAIGAQLDWMVAKCEGVNLETFTLYYHPTEPDDLDRHGFPEFHYSTVWAQAGPIIQREGISTRLNHKQAQLWEAYIWLPTQHDQSEADSNSYTAFGMTPLIAAMRCFCCSKLGDTVEVPEELL